MLAAWMDEAGTHADVDRALASVGEAPIVYFTFHNGPRDPLPVGQAIAATEPVEPVTDEPDPPAGQDQLTLAYQMRHLPHADGPEVQGEAAPAESVIARAVPILALSWPSDGVAARAEVVERPKPPRPPGTPPPADPPSPATQATDLFRRL